MPVMDAIMDTVDTSEIHTNQWISRISTKIFTEFHRQRWLAKWTMSGITCWELAWPNLPELVYGRHGRQPAEQINTLPMTSVALTV